MLTLLHEGTGDDEVAYRWRVAALVYFHDLTLKTAGDVQENAVKPERDGLQIHIEGKGYWIPSPPKAQDDGEERDERHHMLTNSSQ